MAIFNVESTRVVSWIPLRSDVVKTMTPDVADCPMSLNGPPGWYPRVATALSSLGSARDVLLNVAFLYFSVMLVRIIIPLCYQESISSDISNPFTLIRSLLVKIITQ